MPWFKIDDQFWSHPKVLELSDEAVALWVRAGSYCSGHLTDGIVKRSTLRLLGATNDAATELVLAGLWDHVDGTWAFHDWEHYQPSKEHVLAEREAATERKRRSRERSRRDSQSDDGVSHASPTRPDPTRPLSTSDEVESALSPFCYQHPGGTDRPCRRCQNARLRYDLAKTAEKNKPTPTPTRDPECDRHPGYPLPCHRCAEDALSEVRIDSA